VLIEEYVRQGEGLLDAIEQTAHLRARDAEPRTKERPPSLPRAAAPNVGDLAALSAWNEMK